MQSKLAVATTFYLQRLHNIQRCTAQHLVFFIRKSYCRRYYNRIPCVHPYWVKVFHRANGNDIGMGITDDLKLNFFPARDILLNQYLSDRRQTQTIFCNLMQFFWIVRNPTAGTTQRKGRTYNDRIENFLRIAQCILHCLYYLGGNAWLADAEHRVFKNLPVFCLINSFWVSAQKLYAVALQKSFLGQLHGQGKTCLTAQSRENTVWLFNFNDSLHDIQI